MRLLDTMRERNVDPVDGYLILSKADSVMGHGRNGCQGLIPSLSAVSWLSI